MSSCLSCPFFHINHQKMSFHYTTSLAYLLLLATILVSITMEDSSKDKEECAEQLAGLATCLPYVQGEAKAPTPDCCSGLKQVLKSNKKCLCVIIRDRNDPDLSLQINVTLALSLPNVCNAPANVSKCPELLHMDPKSPEAQVFYQLNKNSTKGGPRPAPSPNEGASPRKSDGASTSSQAAGITSRNDASNNGKGFLGLKVLLVGLLVGLFMGSQSPTWALM